MSTPRFPLFWRVFAVNAALLALATLLLLFSPVTVSRPVRFTEALVLVAGFALALAANVVLLRRAFFPLDRLPRPIAFRSDKEALRDLKRWLAKERR